MALGDRLVDHDTWQEDVSKYDFMGVHTTTPFFGDALRILNRLERERFDGRIAFGGPDTT
jgi:hypothetical protein